VRDEIRIEEDDGGARKLIGRASLAAVGSVYQQVVSFLSGLIVARVIGAAEYGVFNLARTLVELSAIVTRLGLEVGLQRFFGEAAAGRDGACVVAVLRRLRLLAATLALLPAAVALGVGRALERDVYQFPHFAQVLLCLALAVPFLTDIAVLGGAYRGVLKLAPAVLTECVLLPTARLVTILVLFSAGWRLWAVVAGTVLGSFLAAALLSLRARSDFRAMAAANAAPWAAAFQVLSYSSVLAVAVLVTTLTGSMDVLVLGRFATAEALGQYALVKMLLVVMAVFGTAFTSGLGALVAERHARGDPNGVVRVMAVTFRFTTLATLPIFAVFLFWGAQIALLFGPSFALSQPVVGWLATAQFVLVAFAPAGWALSMTGKHVLELKILSGGLLLATALCLIAVPAFGQLGAAIAICCATAAVNLARALCVRHLLRASPFGSDIFVIAATGVVLAWASHASAAHLSSSSLLNTIVGIAGFALLYGIANWALFLSDSERSGLAGLFGATAKKLLGRPADARG
jgi:O-antigen/teichoic acid export membrane protein